MHRKNQLFALLLFLSGFTVGGCSSTYTISETEEAQRRLDGKNVSLLLGDGATCAADDLRFRGDSLSFTVRGSDSVRSIALSDIAWAKRTNHGAGAVSGALMTGGAACVFFAILAATDAEREKHDPEPSGSAGAMRSLVVTGGTVLGCVLGALGGAAIGRNETYDFKLGPQKTKPSVPVAPVALSTSEPSTVRNVIRGGFDIPSRLTKHASTFDEGRGYTFGGATGFDLSKKQPGRYLLGMELNYSKITEYLPNITVGIPSSSLYVNQYNLDRMHRVSFVDLGFLPTLMSTLSRHTAVGVYAGPSFGLGSEQYAVNQRYFLVIPASQYNGMYSNYDGLYGDHGAYFRTSVGGTVGVSAYYQWMMVDLRYKITKMTGGHEYHNFYIQAGVVL